MRTPAGNPSLLLAEEEKSREKDLGPQVAVYRGRSLGGWNSLSLLVPGLAGVLAPLGYGLWIIREAYPKYGPVAAETWSRPWFLLATVSTTAFLLLFIYRLYLARQFAVIHQDGLHWRTGFFRSHKLRWEAITGVAAGEIEETFLGLPISRYYRAVVYPSLGKPLSLGGRTLREMPELISRLKASLYPRLLPRLKEMFASGQWLFFGPLAIQAQALRINRQRFLWPEVAKVNVRSGFLVIELKTPPGAHPRAFQFPVSQVPNFELLIQIIEQGVNV